MIQVIFIIVFLCFPLVIDSGMLFALQASGSQNQLGNCANVTQMGNCAMQTNASELGNSAAQTNVLTRLGDVASQTNSTPQLLEKITSQTNETQKGNFASQNITHLGNFASAMEVDNICETATFKRGENDGMTLEEFVYKFNCVPPQWASFWAKDSVKKAINEISRAIESDFSEDLNVQPPLYNVFRAFQVEPGKVRVVILGQDPTTQPDKATGLAFSLFPTEDPKSVPSVFNMLIELKLEGFDVSLTNGDLTPWVEQGVMLLNSALTIRIGVRNAAGSHVQIWKPFTDALIDHMNKDEGVPRAAWILWGEKAKTSCKSLARDKHGCRQGGHPSPRAGGKNSFIGGNYFKCANAFLQSIGQPPIVWDLKPREGAGPDMALCKDMPMPGQTSPVN
ncbi:uracil-DNA glycosylase-like [Montipora capricornis]|uniref:uracil-DNA glycosylase-like n=1 Tax=Montipora capricornis TaxID=246305 RepID=UPI0035F104D1